MPCFESCDSMKSIKFHRLLWMNLTGIIWAICGARHHHAVCVPRARCGPLARVHGVVAQVACFCPQKRMWSARDHRVLVQHGGCILKNSIDLCRKHGDLLLIRAWSEKRSQVHLLLTPRPHQQSLARGERPRRPPAPERADHLQLMTWSQMTEHIDSHRLT